MQHKISYRHNHSTLEDILCHLSSVDKDYAVTLSSRIDINEYSHKLFEKSDRIEAWEDNILVGLVAYYNNQSSSSLYISNVSVSRNFRSNGVASAMLNMIKDIAKKNNFAKISLEADDSLIEFYSKFDFYLEKQTSTHSHELVYYCNNKDIIVSICCLVYNHEPYLRQCFDGFVMQQTTFPIEILVHDDASTDHSADIIREYTVKYPDLFRPIYQTKNQYSKGIPITATYQIPRAKGKYIAVCEGDDYWINPLKLQRQVDFLETHEEYVLCAHNAIVKNELTGELSCFNNWLDEHTFSYSDIIDKEWFLPTQSLLYRNHTIPTELTLKRFHNGDYYNQLCLTMNGGLVHYSNECMSVYRRGVGVSRNDMPSENDKRLIELLTFMKSISDPTFNSTFNEKISRLEQRITKQEYQEKHFSSKWYKYRFKALKRIIKLVNLQQPSVKIYLDE